MDCAIGDIMVLVCHVILQNHGIKDSCDFIGRSPLTQVIILTKLGEVGTVLVEL